jgi:hypothetical protein
MLMRKVRRRRTLRRLFAWKVSQSMITVRLAPENGSKSGTGAPGDALTVVSHLLPRGDSEMTRREQELLEKQLWGVSPRSPQNGIIILIIVAVFLVGMGIGDILSKTKQASTHYAALISYPGQK